jgi:heme exporter protein D
MSWVAVGVSGVSMVSGVIGSFQAKKEKKRIAREIANQKRPELINAAEGLQVSTRGADLQREEVARNSATSLSDAGTRALGVGVGRVAAVNADSNAKIGANLDEQQKGIDMIRAQDNATIRGIKEGRSASDLAALSSQYNAAQQNGTQAMGNVLQGAGMAGNALTGSDYFSAENIAARKLARRGTATSVSSLKPAGLNPLKTSKIG